MFFEGGSVLLVEDFDCLNMFCCFNWYFSGLYHQMLILFHSFKVLSS